MKKSDQTLDELYSLVVYQIELQKYHVEKEGVKGIGYIIFFIFLLVVPLGLCSGELLLALFFNIFFISPFLIMLLIHQYQNIKYYTSIKELYNLSRGTDKKIEDFNEILTLIKKLKKILDKKGNKFIGLGPIELEIRTNQYKYFNLLIEDLKFDLVKKMKDMGKTLESGKSELSGNLKGTPELSKVSELQSARLDRQIKQFEELQRVLVKM